MATDMTIIRGVRYRVEDAVRLGLVNLDGTASKPADPPASSTLLTSTETGNTQETPPVTEEKTLTPARPSVSGKKADWVAFALANGKTEAEIADLKRDDIVALFPTE